MKNRPTAGVKLKTWAGVSGYFVILFLLFPLKIGDTRAAGFLWPMLWISGVLVTYRMVPARSN